MRTRLFNLVQRLRPVHFLRLFLLVLPLVAASAPAPAQDARQTAIFAGGCFWCVESDFDHVDGVLETVSGYSGGSTSENVTYKNHGAAGHREVVRITFDSNKISYGELLDIFWRSVDPTDAGGQFCDRGHSYSTAIYTLNEEQAEIARNSKNTLEKSGKLKAPVVTPISPAGRFFAAEDYHQDYHNKNPLRYSYYRFACGRDARVSDVWGSEAHKGIEK
ncbi:peptide-methionine (S)-S-oxide reductase MsrA [uncultured Cohaesibacter sp.]|uniref:peptide-methionine (S)-S-oxide reductase MsrA n=1 Tax=uncultured Cohaesibacter sp. TaxID=1002546 RepID=UPI0029C74EB0|nr:peptide-methionine (S)-S-oxide reductase MsrA [uncultured Cohaesibacter sp.]